MQVPALINALLMLLPNASIAPEIPVVTSASMSAYSAAVAPLSHFQNRAQKFPGIFFFPS